MPKGKETYRRENSDIDYYYEQIVDFKIIENSVEDKIVHNPEKGNMDKEMVDSAFGELSPEYVFRPDNVQENI